MSENTKTRNGGIWPGIIVAAVLVLVGGAAWKARDDARQRHEDADLERILSAMEGHMTCRLAYLAAQEQRTAGGRRYLNYKPETLPPLSADQPPVVSCATETFDGKPAAPLVVQVLCEDKRRECVRLLPTQKVPAGA